MLTLALYHYIIMTRFTVSVYAVFTYLYIYNLQQVWLSSNVYFFVDLCTKGTLRYTSNAQLYFNNAVHGSS